LKDSSRIYIIVAMMRTTPTPTLGDHRSPVHSPQARQHRPQRQSPFLGFFFGVSPALMVVTHTFVAISAFNAGLLIGFYQQKGTKSSSSSVFSPSSQTDFPAFSMQGSPSSPVPLNRMQETRLAATKREINPPNPLLTQQTLGHMIAGIGRVNRNDFSSFYDIGVPLDLTSPGNEDVLLFYTTTSSLPLRSATKISSHVGSDDYDHLVIPSDKSVIDATANCDVMKVVLTRPDVDRHCIAIMGQWDSYHVHKFMRLPPDNEMGKDFGRWDDPDRLNASYPLRYVSRTHQANGQHGDLPTLREMQRYTNLHMQYISKLDDTLARLKPIARQAAAATSATTRGGSRKAIVVMVCNWGQTELFLNFVCNARSRGLDLSKVLLFATDHKTFELANSLGIRVFDVRDSFGTDAMPEDAAQYYGDEPFTKMMLSKAYVAHLVVSCLGYDMLFQDVDVVWNRDPLAFFLSNATSPVGKDFDLYFQDDGARSDRYQPYSPNSGFYFVRHNTRTEYLFNCLVKMGDHILATNSHQETLTSLMSEHSSLTGLRVKVFGRDSAIGRTFPGGFHYHRRDSEFMKDLVLGKTDPPYIFHMSWTKNKDNKRLFLQQMGEWFVREECDDGEAELTNAADASITVPDNLSNSCCAVEPIVKCHFRDKPSVVPCRDSPSIDKDRPSFW